MWFKFLLNKTASMNELFFPAHKSKYQESREWASCRLPIAIYAARHAITEVN